MGDSSVCTSSSARTLVLPAISGRPEIMQSPRWALTRRKVARACGLAQRGSLMLMSNGDDLDPATFRNSLRNLGVKLTPVELGALFRAFDVNGDGTVGAAEFAKALYDMGRVERRQQIKSERAANAPATCTAEAQVRSARSLSYAADPCCAGEWRTQAPPNRLALALDGKLAHVRQEDQRVAVHGGLVGGGAACARAPRTPLALAASRGPLVLLLTQAGELAEGEERHLRFTQGPPPLY